MSSHKEAPGITNDAVFDASGVNGATTVQLGGAQSALAGTHFVVKAGGPEAPDITGVAPYAAFGAFYFLVSAIWLTVREARARRLLSV